MAYAIMRCEKISTKGNLAASISHAYRTRETENANPRISNEIIVEYDKTKVDQEVEQARTRKDNVIMYDVFLGVSPEWYEKSSSIDFTKWKQNSIEWLKEEFGEENIKSVVLHRDEQTPHIQAHILPRYDGKLNAKHWTGGKEKCSKLQDRYHAKVRICGLERGEKGSKARHEKVSKYYKRVNSPEEEIKISYPEPSISDRLQIAEYGYKVAQSVSAQIMPELNRLKSKVKELEHISLKSERKIYQKQNEKYVFLESKYNLTKRQLDQKEKTQEEFFHIFNSLFETGRQIILTSDRYPKEIEKIEERLKSRFGWGLTTAIEPPDLETRVAILLKKAEEHHMELPEEVAFFIAQRLRTNVRELEGALNRVKAMQDFKGGHIDIDFVRDTLKDILALQERLVTIENIQKVVAEYYRIKVADLKSKSRARSVTRPRQVAMALAKELTNKSLPEIGRAFERDHTTVLNACREVPKFREKDSSIQEDWANLIRTLSA